MPTVSTASDALPPVSDGSPVPPPDEQAVASRAIPAMPATIGASLRVLTCASLHFRWTVADVGPTPGLGPGAAGCYRWAGGLTSRVSRRSRTDRPMRARYV